jgi:hypothetical protein
MTILISVYVSGIFLDGWAHNHIAELETFFTPWHAIFYAGFALVAALLVGTLLKNRARGYPWRQALPVGYELSLLGVLVFTLGGLGDMIWHIIFGVEANVDALYSPTHLLLGLGSGLIITGPWRAAWRRKDAPTQGFVSHLPMLISLTLFVSVLTFFTQVMAPFGSTFAAEGRRPQAFSPMFGALNQPGLERIAFYNQALGIASVLIQTSLLLGPVLLVVRRWRLPLGSLTLVFGLNAVLMTIMRDQALATGPYPLIAVAVLAGLAADLLVHQLRPSAVRPGAFRLFAVAVPTILYTLYFLAVLLFGGGIWWTIHLWTGAVVLAGIAGWLLSYLVVPPAWPDEQPA